jgi:transcriptional regulator with XRE-family HTH domain
MPTWNEQLRAARKGLGMSRQALADLSGQSYESLRSYELGRRRPTREHLAHLLKSMKLDQPARNLVLVSAGFAPEAPVERYPEPNIPSSEAVRLIRQRAWPAFLVSQRAEVLAVSGATERLLGLVEPGRNLTPRRSVLTAATRRALAARAANWDELVAGLIAFFKAGVPEEPSLDAPGPYLNAALKQLTAGDPALMTRFVALWETTPPFQGRMTGFEYSTIWNARNGTIRFSCHVGCLNTEIGLYAHTWIPADAQSHRLLEELLASSPPSPRPRLHVATPRPSTARRRKP